MVSVSFDVGRFQNGVARSRWNFLRTVEIYANQARMASLVVVADGAFLLYETRAIDRPRQQPARSERVRHFAAHEAHDNHVPYQAEQYRE